MGREQPLRPEMQFMTLQRIRGPERAHADRCCVLRERLVADIAELGARQSQSCSLRFFHQRGMEMVQ